MRKISLLVGELALLALIKTPVFATDKIQLTTGKLGPAIDPAKVNIGGVIGFVVGAAVVIGVLAALLFIIQGALQWITSGGDKAKVESARNHIVAAVIGLIIIVLSLVLMNFVLELLGIGNLTTKGIQFPTLQ